MPLFTKNKVSSIWARMPDIRRFLSTSFTKQTAVCPFEIVRGVTKNTEAGYQPEGAQPRDFTDFEQVIEGFDPIIVEWEDSVRFPFDGTLDQRHEQAPKIKVNDGNTTSYEKSKVFPRGSVFQYEDGTEFKLPQKKGETDDEYQSRFKEELGKELDRLSKPENKKKDTWGREYFEQMHSKYYVKQYQTGRYFSAYFLSDEAKMVMKSWAGNEALQSMGVQKQLTMLILNTESNEVFPYVRADGYTGNKAFFDRIDKYRRVLWRIPEYDLTYDLDNLQENEERKRKGFRGSMLSVDRTWFYLNVTSYLRSPKNKQVLGVLAAFNSLNDHLGKSGVAINTHVQQGGPGEPFAEPTLKDIYARDREGKEKEPKRLIGRLPVLDSQFTIPRPVTSATITFHGMCAFNSIAFYGRRAENFSAAREGLEMVSPSGLIFPHEFHKSQWDPLTMRKPAETTFSVGSLHPMLQSYQKISELFHDIQNPQKFMPSEGIFNIPSSTFEESNKTVLPFWDSGFLSKANWELFLKNLGEFNPDDEKEPDDADNLWMTLANPYMKAVKNREAIKEALSDPKNKKPVWIGPKKFNYGNVPPSFRTLPTLNMLNWFTHNSYIEIPMTQRMALYFDSRASDAVNSAGEKIGQSMGSVAGIMGPAGVVGGMFGGPVGMVFGGLLGAAIGKIALSKAGAAIGRVVGSIIGTATGFIWNSSGMNSLGDNQKRQLPGFMCLLPKDKLEIYIKTLFHMSLYGGARHVRLPYNYLTTADNYPDKLAATLGRSEISFTFTLTDNMWVRNYDRNTGEAYSETLHRTFDIGQDKEEFNGIPLIDEYARLHDPFYSGSNNPDKRILWDGYGYIVEGFNIKCCGKVPYTITFYSPQGYLAADEKGDLKTDEEKWRHVYNSPSYQVWRGQYLSQAAYADDTRLWQNTKNLAKPHHRAWLPYRYPRGVLPVPPVDLKDPTWWGEEKSLKVPTQSFKTEVGNIFTGKEIIYPGEGTETQRVLVAKWKIPEGYSSLKFPIPLEVKSYFKKQGVNSDVILTPKSPNRKLFSRIEWEYGNVRVHEESYTCYLPPRDIYLKRVGPASTTSLITLSLPSLAKHNWEVTSSRKNLELWTEEGDKSPVATSVVIVSDFMFDDNGYEMHFRPDFFIGGRLVSNRSYFGVYDKDPEQMKAGYDTVPVTRNKVLHSWEEPYVVLGVVDASLLSSNVQGVSGLGVDWDLQLLYDGEERAISLWFRTLETKIDTVNLELGAYVRDSSSSLHFKYEGQHTIEDQCTIMKSRIGFNQGDVVVAVPPHIEVVKRLPSPDEE